MSPATVGSALSFSSASHAAYLPPKGSSKTQSDLLSERKSLNLWIASDRVLPADHLWLQDSFPEQIYSNTEGLIPADPTTPWPQPGLLRPVAPRTDPFGFVGPIAQSLLDVTSLVDVATDSDGAPF